MHDPQPLALLELHGTNRSRWIWRFYAPVLGSESADVGGTTAGLRDEQRDPVCGMRIENSHGRHLSFGGSDYYFCSASCEQQFAADLERFLRAT